MKQFKRLLALGLAFALAIGLALPAMAVVNWDDFRITKQPQNLTIQKGESFTLGVEVTIPDGVEVGYEWYGAGARRIADKTDPVLQIGPSDSAYPSDYTNRAAETSYRCKITAYEKDSTGETIESKMLYSETVSVTVEDNSFQGKLYSVIVGPFQVAGGITLTYIMLSFGLVIPISPLIFLFFLIRAFFESVGGLF